MQDDGELAIHHLLLTISDCRHDCQRISKYVSRNSDSRSHLLSLLVIALVSGFFTGSTL